jgi:stearoyl-CoA desaturase (delta-9 desaturase)
MPGFGALGTQWWMPVLFIVIAGHLTNVAVTLFLHREQTHRGVKFHALVSVPMRVWLWLTTAIKTREWVACHRKHHAFADREGDPHSPLMDGLRNILLKGAFYYRKAVRQPGVLEKYGKGTPSDWLERHLLDRRNWLGILMMLLIDLYLFGWMVGPLVWAVQMIWIPFWAAGVINGIGHAFGYRNHDVKDASRNITPIAIWLGGEELHNNHHADPHSARFAHRWFEFDIGWVYIKLMSFVGLAQVRYARMSVGERGRDEMSAVDRALADAVA